MTILGACALCGRRGCTSAHYDQPGKGMSVRGSSRRGLPLAVYETPAGETLRLNAPDARRLGLLPPEPEVSVEELPVEEAGVPAGARVGEVLAWAGDDRHRLQEALDNERAGRQRVSLVAELERRLAQ